MSTSKPTPDWHVIEFDYRAGIKPLRQMAEEHGITHGAINKRAKKEGWSRDLGAKIRAKADELVSRAAVSEEVSKARLATEREVVESNAEMQYQARMRHRSDLADLRRIYCLLLRELEDSCTPEGREELVRLLELVVSAEVDPDDPRGQARAEKMRDSLHRAISLSTRIDNAKKLVEIQEKIIRLEREALGIKEDAESKREIEELLEKVGRA